MLNYALYSHLDNLPDILQGFLSGIAPGSPSSRFKGWGIGNPTVLVGFHYYSENVCLHGVPFLLRRLCVHFMFYHRPEDTVIL